MSSRIEFLDQALGDYVNDRCTPFDEIEARLVAQTQQMPQAAMQIGQSQARFMGLMARILRPRVVVEVGTFTGLSALVVARELTPDAKLIACDISDEWTSIGARYWREAGVADRIDLRIAPALDTLAGLGDELGSGVHVDMAFIDADKTGYWSYLDALIPLMGPASVVLVDNVLWSGQVLEETDQSVDTIAMREFNDAVVGDTRVDVAMLPVGDGLSMITLAV